MIFAQQRIVRVFSPLPKTTGLTIVMHILALGLRAKPRRVRPDSMCNFAWLFRTLLAVSVILPFADAIPQTSPAPAQASPSTAPTRDVTGRWDFRMETGPDRTARGELWLFARGEEFTGTATVQGRNALPVRVLTLRGERIAMTVDTPEGPVTFDGTLNR